MRKKPFWEEKSLAEISRYEWEQLCDGCARCCLHKLEDEENGDIFYTDVACQLLDQTSCRCVDYRHRLAKVPDCLALSPEKIDQFHWLPDTCAYRLLAAGRQLKAWHPLVSGDPESVHRAGISVRGRVVEEFSVAEQDMEDHVIHWVSS